MIPVYIESSAVLAWILGEPAGSSVKTLVDDASMVFSSALTIAETRRALIRGVTAERLTAAGERHAVALLSSARTGWASIEIDEATWDRVGQPFPAEPLRTLDALHLALVLRVAPAYEEFAVLTLDQRVRAGAEALGLRVLPAATVDAN